MRAESMESGASRLSVKPGGYTLRLAVRLEEVRAAQTLRFEVFNVELNEGLAGSFLSGLDADPFDAVCDHLIVEERATGRVVGTYRLQSGVQAAENLGFYSAREFDLSPFEPLRPEIIELGRACVDRGHRNLNVLGLLWRGIADYAGLKGARYLIGCSSMNSRDPAEGASAYSELCRRHMAAPELRTRPQPAWECPLRELAPSPPEIPKLLRAYLTIGARICGPPAIDREFGTIDFLTLVDLARLPAPVRAKFFREPAC